MIVTTKNDRKVELRMLCFNEYERLFEYLSLLSPETKKRFGPHPFDRQSIMEIFNKSDHYRGYLAVDTENSEIIAYSIVKQGYLEHDRFRLESYGLTLNSMTDVTYAPSVADAWQSQGVGNQLFHYMLGDLKQRRIKRIILWGGVQADNEKAVKFYLKNGFRVLGKFEYNGQNQDMVLEISQ